MQSHESKHRKTFLISIGKNMKFLSQLNERKFWKIPPKSGNKTKIVERKLTVSVHRSVT
jgi:hypothetical protein